MSLFTKEDIKKSKDIGEIEFERDLLGNLKQSKAPEMSLASRVELPLPKKQSVEPAQKKSEKLKAIEPIKRMPEVVNKSPQAKPKPTPMRNIASVVGKSKFKAQEKGDKARAELSKIEGENVKIKKDSLSRIKQSNEKLNKLQEEKNQIIREDIESQDRMRTISESILQNAQMRYEKRQEKRMQLEQSLKTPERKKLISETKPMAMLMEFAIKGTFMALHNLALPEGNPYSENNINRGQDFMSLWNQSVEKDYREQIEQQTLLGRQLDQLRKLDQDDMLVFDAYKKEQGQIMQSKLAYYAANTRHEEKKRNAELAMLSIGDAITKQKSLQHQRDIDVSNQESQREADMQIREDTRQHQLRMRALNNKDIEIRDQKRHIRDLQKMEYGSQLATEKQLAAIEAKGEGGKDGFKIGSNPETQIKIADKAGLKEARNIRKKYGKQITPSINFLNVVNGTSTDPDHQKYSRTIKAMQGDSFIKQKGKLTWADLKSKGGIPNEYKQTVSWLVGVVEQIASAKRIDLTGGGNMTDREKLSLYRATGVTVPTGTKLDKNFSLEKYIVKAIVDKTLQGNVKELTKESATNYWSEMQAYTNEKLSREHARKNLLENF